MLNNASENEDEKVLNEDTVAKGENMTTEDLPNENNTFPPDYETKNTADTSEHIDNNGNDIMSEQSGTALNEADQSFNNSYENADHRNVVQDAYPNPTQQNAYPNPTQQNAYSMADEMDSSPVNDPVGNDPVDYNTQSGGQPSASEEQNKSNFYYHPLHEPAVEKAKKEKKDKQERSFRRGRMVLAFLCVILATSIITSAVSYSVWDYYAKRDNNNDGFFSSEDISEDVTESNGTTSENLVNSQDSAGRTKLTASQVNKKVSPSVVFIAITATTTDFFGQDQTQTGSGSGIIISNDGYIVTNFHVVDGSEEVNVKLNDGKSYKAKLIGKDAQTDLAVIKIDAKNLKAATLGDSSKLEVGDTALAIGNPLGTENGSLTVGVISALNRVIAIENFSMNLIQTDAAVNPGNSGGALANAYGEVIGIVNAKTSAVGIEGLGYAIPINEAKTVVNLLRTKGYVPRVIIGISIEDITKEIADKYGLPVGVYIESVTKGSPADKAGIKPRDVIIAIDGKKVETSAELAAIRDKRKAGDVLNVRIVRQSKEMTLKLTLEDGK
jgi:serine protease Do